jgi:hypothetical protein
MNPVIAEINRTADDPSVSVHLPVPLAETLIGMVGGERPTEGWGRWIFPDGFRTWDTDEALRYALQVAPGILDV